MGIYILLAVVCGIVVGRVLDGVIGGGGKLQEAEELGADEAVGAVAAEADEAAGAVAAEGAPLEPQAAETGEEVAANGPVITLKAPPKRTGENGLQEVILDVLSGSGEPMTLAEIATKIGKKHFAGLIGPMLSLLESKRVIKEDRMYRLA